jgi:hypothetical protein
VEGEEEGGGRREWGSLSPQQQQRRQEQQQPKGLELQFPSPWQVMSGEGQGSLSVSDSLHFGVFGANSPPSLSRLQSQVRFVSGWVRVCVCVFVCVCGIFLKCTLECLGPTARPPCQDCRARCVLCLGR